MANISRFFFFFGALALASPALAQSDSRSPFTATAFHRFSTDLDGGGEVSSQTYFARIGAPLVREEDFFAAVSVGFGLDRYDFSGGGLAADQPWEDIQRIQLGAPLSFDMGDRWSFFGLPSVRSVREEGADFGDSISGGAILGASYRFGERLTLGPGVGYHSQLEDDASIFPVIFVDWKINDSLSLSTGPTIGSTLGPGLSLNYSATDSLSFSIGARYEKLRFRLDDGGVGEDRTIPLFASMTVQATENWRVSLLGGVGFGTELSQEDTGGRVISKADADPAPFVGIHAGFSF